MMPLPPSRLAAERRPGIRREPSATPPAMPAAAAVPRSAGPFAFSTTEPTELTPDSTVLPTDSTEWPTVWTTPLLRALGLRRFAELLLVELRPLVELRLELLEPPALRRELPELRLELPEFLRDVRAGVVPFERAVVDCGRLAPLVLPLRADDRWVLGVFV